MFKKPTSRLFNLLTGAALLVGLLGITATAVFAFNQSNFISFTLEGCRNDGTITLPIAGKFVCPNAAYTTGNLGKGWNELDLVPHRLTTASGNQNGVTTDYDVYIAADYQLSGKTGYDVISVPVVNTAMSDASCSVTAGPQSTQGSASSPFGGGTDVVIYRQLTIHQAKNTTCVFDYYQRLALGSHLYSGASLQSYMFEQTGLSGGKKTISIPVNAILPQSLSKTMSATQSQDFAWNVVKSPSPASLSFGNTCDASNPTSQGVSIEVTWTKLDATLGAITVITNVYATNPSARTITTSVTDVIYTGTTPIDSTSATKDVPANTASFLMLTHQITVPAGTVNLNDVATGTYTDTVTGIPIPGTTTATASAVPQISGTTNGSATINDSESITGTGLTFSADTFSPAVGGFDNGYVAGTATTGPVSWTSSTQPSSGSVTFNKTVYVAGPSQVTGKLSDTATLTGSSGFTTSATADVNISTDARVNLTISKTIMPAPGFSGQTFTFHVFNASNAEVAAPTITFGANDKTLTTTVTDLAPGAYTVSEDAVSGWVMDSNKSATITLPTCSGSVSFSNVQVFSPSITTTPNPATVTVGGTLNDTAVLAGGNNPTGQITFALYNPTDTTCSATPTVTEVVPVNGNGTYSTTSGGTATQAGTWRWKASYSGDSYNNPASSGCQDELVTVNKASPSITTQASPTSGTVGQAINVSDTATFTGAYGNPGGTLNFTLYSDNQCTVSTGMSSTVNGPFASQFTFTQVGWTPAATGTYYWQVVYSGDSNNNGYTTGCADANEQIVIGKASPSITTQASPITGTVGQALTVGDTATLSGGFNPTGSVTFTLYSDNQCTVATGVSGPGTLSAGSASFSTSWTPSAAGTYYWKATYPGDANNNGFTTGCGDANEQVVIAKAPPAISTSATNATGPSTSVSDTATLTGGYNPTGTITFKLYGPSATASCTASNLVFTSAALPVNGNGTYGSGLFSPTAVGTYYWIASYSGDANNAAVTGACGDAGETSVVSPGSAKVIKTVSGAAPTGTLAFTFQLRSGASVSADGTILETVDANSSNNWTINFTTQLVPGQQYQLCEWVLPGWNTSLGPNLFVPNSIIPPSLPNPNVNNVTVCTNFVAEAGQTTTFNVDNTPPPGGRALTIGFWKNWASCANSNGKGQKPMLDQTLAVATGFAGNTSGGLVVSAQNPGGGWPSFAPNYYLVLKGSTSTPNVAPDCMKAVNLLNKTTIDGKKKMASDPLFNMAAQLVAAQLNYFAGAGKNAITTVEIQRAVLLLGKYGFNGTSYSPKLTTADTNTANCLATQLDNYNNDRPVSACP